MIQRLCELVIVVECQARTTMQRQVHNHLCHVRYNPIKAYYQFD